MLKKEKAQEMLRAETLSNALEARLAAAEQLPLEVRRVAYAILQRDDEGKPLSRNDWQLQNKRQWQGLNELAGLPGEARRMVLGALFLGLWEQVEAGWELLGRLPYPVGAYRRPFRVPPGVYPHSHNRRRLNWLHILLSSLAPYCHKEVAWLAQWAAYLGYNSQPLGILFAGAIEAGGPTGQAVYDTLVASAKGEHPIGMMGRHVTTGLLCASREEGWEFIEKFLLAAQRQEGLRQVILETVDEAHPQAFRRMLRVILEHDLTRFSATVRAVDVWFGFGWDVTNIKMVREILEQIAGFLDNEAAQDQALASGDGQTVYLALWAMANENALEAIEKARGLLVDPQVERRFGAVTLLSQLGLLAARPLLLRALEDSDLRIAAQAITAFNTRYHYDEVAEGLGDTDLFERLEKLIVRVEATSAAPKPLVWPWRLPRLEVSDLADLLVDCLGPRPVERLIPYLSKMDASYRVQVAKLLATSTNLSEGELSRVLLALVCDSHGWVSEEALKLLGQRQLGQAEIAEVEKLAGRMGGSSSRRAALELLLRQVDEQVFESANRLLAADTYPPRVAGLELLAGMVRVGRMAGESRARLQQFRDRRKTLTAAEKHALDNFDKEEASPPSLENGLGLVDLAELTPLVTPRPINFVANTPAARKCLVALNELVEHYRETPVKIDSWRGTEEQLLGNLGGYGYGGYGFPVPGVKRNAEEAAQQLQSWPLSEVWLAWEKERPAHLRDKDGLELVRALLLLGTNWLDSKKGGESELEDAASDAEDAKNTLNQCDKVLPSLQHRAVDEGVLRWLVWYTPVSGAVDLLLDGLECTLDFIARERAGKEVFVGEQIWDQNRQLTYYQNLVELYRQWHPGEWQPAHKLRLWQLYHWLSKQSYQMGYRLSLFGVMLEAYELGGATGADIVEHLVGGFHSKEANNQRYYGRGLTDWHNLSGRKPDKLVENYPVLARLVPALREKTLEIELARGDLPTVATGLALQMRWAGGMEVFVKALAALGRESPVRGYLGYSQERPAVLSKLLKNTTPLPQDKPPEFARLLKEAAIPQQRLIEAALYAPQWAAFIEEYLGWEGFSEAVWWLHAHTKDRQWQIEPELRESWAAEISQRTPLLASDLMEGAVDVQWFSQLQARINPDHWEALYEAAKYVAGGNGHNRAKLFADAMLGRVKGAKLAERITAKRHQDAVRALGLVPLSASGDETEAQKEVVARYRLIQEFLRSSRQFGAQRRASEELAGRIGLENLARTAGYPDPVRLQWAMEAELIADLKGKPVRASAGEYEARLEIDRWGEPQLAFFKSGKAVKALPGAVKKEPEIAGLVARKQEIERQKGRMRLSLEQAMCRGDRFSAGELLGLLEHPVLAPMLEKLVFVGEAGEGLAGYPEIRGEGGSRQLGLRFYDNSFTTLASATGLRIAHPYDLLRGGAWPSWQHECFAQERVQPFKQVFRELYILNQSERRVGDEAVSERYAGHQVQPRQALALLGQRGWLSSYEEGVHRTFHAEGLTCWVTFNRGYSTPLEVEGLTVAGVYFTRSGQWKPVPLGEVPPRVFSEAMRDLDLVVSVAHMGGVDPEASQSTVEMRAALVEETCQLLSLSNVAVKSSHALVKGELGDYSVHLGSALVHRQPGGALCIVPVPSQHRGRLFLPFADNDPKTAEVVSKILLLANDRAIKDPVILEQILV